MKILFLFLDGVGLGSNDPAVNPFTAQDFPALNSFTGGLPWTVELSHIESERATFIPIDACLGVAGRPQSATGQAAILTGMNVPQIIGQHYGPKPNPQINALIRRNNFFKNLAARGLSISAPSAYPPGFFEALRNRRRLLSANQLALHTAGVRMLGVDALYEGKALSSDFTGQGWHDELGYTDTPILTPYEAGQRLVELSDGHALTFFDHWITDYAGHRGPFDEAVKRIDIIDQVIAGMLDAWDDGEGLILLTSDHGNIENQSERKHTRNQVPTIIIGDQRHTLADGLTDLTHFAHRIVQILSK